jgi:hypothetical protein
VLTAPSLSWPGCRDRAAKVAPVTQALP